MPTSLTTWAQYVRLVTDGDRQSEIARKSGVDQTTISRWMNESNTSGRSPASVLRFARAYRVNVLEAFVLAGFMSADEAELDAPTLVDLRRASETDLLAELARRADERVSADGHQYR